MPLEDARWQTPLIVGSLTLRPSYGGEPDRVWIEQSSGEGGDFPADEVEAVLQAYYKDRF